MQKIALLLLSLFFVGCYATTGGMRAKRTDPSAGAARTYAGKCDLHFAGAKKTLQTLSLDILEADEGSGEILARRSVLSLNGDGGDRVAVWLDAANGGTACRIRVYGRGQNAFGAGGDDWAKDFFGTYRPPFVD